MSSIQLQGIALNNPTPMFALEIDFAVGQPRVRCSSWGT